MSAFDRLEAQLRQAAPAVAIRPTADRKPGRCRRTRLPIIALAALLAVSGAAVAARHALDIGQPVNVRTGGDPAPSSSHGPGIVVRHSVKLLPARVADPYGGPPWAMRVFRSDRGAACVQVGQVYRGRFGLVRPADVPPYTVAFRALPARAGGSLSLCSGTAIGGFPVLRGHQQIEVRGGAHAPESCRANGKPARCPVTEVRSIRYGLLGPSARAATLTDDGGTAIASQSLSPAAGGAYLFVTRVPEAAYRRADTAQRRIDWMLAAAAARAHAEAQARHLPPRQALAAIRRSRERVLRAARDVLATRRPRLRRTGVDVGFLGGRRLRVAGPGRTHRALPGVPRRRAPAARAVRARVSASPRSAGRNDVVTITFRAPVPISRFDASYRQRLAGPWRPPGCRFHRFGQAYKATGATTRPGQVVSFSIHPIGSPQRWCPGRYTARITLHSNGRDRFVGDAQFVVR